MKNIFKNQIEKNPRVSSDTIDEYEDRPYLSGRKVEIGDVILFGLLIKDSYTDERGMDVRELELVMINEKDFYLYEPDHNPNEIIVPTFKIKKHE